METAQDDAVVEGLQPGQLEQFVTTLTEEQRALWTPIRRALRGVVGRARRARGEGNKRDDLYRSMQAAIGRVQIADIDMAIQNAILKGDTQMMRLLAQMAGFDLSARPQQPAGPGAEIIVIRPHPQELDAATEAEVRRRIEALEAPREL
ncbi:MAG TPA: hypothetical protein VKU00_26360 [Chthonomonadaceae bacterium]|nr:hypothetical protein [Chthonomonadaceae bacterium]